jgi:hypothetical protein
MSQRSNARGRQRHAPISEAAIRESVEALDWTKLEKALRLVPARDFDISAICDSIRHCTSIIFRYPNAARERRRDAFFQSLADYVVLRQEKGADQTVRDLVALVTLIEKGYWSILDLLKQTIAAKKPASESIAAILSLGAHQTSAMLKAAFEQARAAEVFEPAAIALTDANGAVYAAEEITEMVSVTTSLSLIMYAVQQHWIAPDGTIVLPALPRVGDVERTYADDVQKLAEAWAFWRMIEERCRYEGGDIEALFENMNDGGSSDDIVLSYRPSKDANEWERRTVANYERLNTEVSSIHHHLAFRTDARLRVKNAAEEEISLFPTSFISLTELQSAHALDFMLSTQIAIESTRYLGLRLTEWLRGYSALQLMASKLVDGETRNPDLLIWKVEPKAL